MESVASCPARGRAGRREGREALRPWLVTGGAELVEVAVQGRDGDAFFGGLRR